MNPEPPVTQEGELCPDSCGLSWIDSHGEVSLRASGFGDDCAIGRHHRRMTTQDNPRVESCGVGGSHPDLILHGTSAQQ
jgi:hypothetical protein